MNLPPWPYIVLQNVPGNFSLDSVTNLLQHLGNPHLKLPPIIHVSGTNGKGSIIAYIRAIFEDAGYKAHVYTSPHLVDFNERIVVASEIISDSDLLQLSERTRIISEKNNIDHSFFDAITAMAFLIFSEVKSDVVLLETGLGGRVDSTNIIEKPLLSIISTISYDHMEYLGETIVSIASEKAGIIKNNSDVIISDQLDEVFDVLFSRADKKKSRYKAFGYNFTIKKTLQGFEFLSNKENIKLPLPSLKGDHQLVNASVAVQAIQNISHIYDIKNHNIINGIASAKWTGRLEKVSDAKLNKLGLDLCDIWLDAAHNNHGAQVLACFIKDNIKTPIYLILGMTKNRNPKEFLQQFLDQNVAISKIFTTTVHSELSSYTGERLARLLDYLDIEVINYDSLDHILFDIKNNVTCRKNITILITGSMFLISDFLKL